MRLRLSPENIPANHLCNDVGGGCKNETEDEKSKLALSCPNEGLG